jgi:hypothetical protein
VGDIYKKKGGTTMKKETTLSSYGKDDKITHVLPNGKVVTISDADSSFYRELIKLPAFAKISLMHLSIEEMQEHINKTKNELNAKLLDLLKKEWYWRMTGELAEFYPEVLPTNKYAIPQLIKICESKRKLPLEDIKLLIEFFTGDNSELYLKEEE